MTVEPTSGNTPEPEEPLYETLSALEQAMESEERQTEGSFLTGGNTRDFVELRPERELDEDQILNPKPVKDGPVLLAFLREKLHKFDAPYAYIGGEANSPPRSRFNTAEVRILIARLSTYESTSLSMSHSLMAQIYQELPFTFCDLAFLPKPNDYDLLRDHGFPVWFGTNTKLSPQRFDVLSITHAVSMEQLNFVPLLHDSGIPLFKQQRMDRPNIPIIICGGANSGTTAPLAGTFRTKVGQELSCLVDAVIYGDGEQAAKAFIEVVREGKEKGWSKREILRACHGRVEGFYEPDLYEHYYDGAGRITRIEPKEEYVAFPVYRSIVMNLDEVRTLETKILPYTGDGASVDVSIAGSTGCIGPGGHGACSFCREGSESTYRERSLSKVLEALEQATKNQGTKEVSFFSLNFNQYKDFFPLVHESVKKGYKVGLISQRVDMLAETPEQIKVQRYLKKSNYTLGIEGVSERMRAYLNKNLKRDAIIKVCTEMMRNGAGELKLFHIVCGIETEEDCNELIGVMEEINRIRDENGWSTRFRVSFTPLFPSAYTSLQFSPALAAVKHGSRSLDPIFRRAKELGWGRRLSVSGEEPLVSNTINHGGRNIFSLLMDSHFRDDYRFYGSVAKGTWARWKKRIDKDPNIDLDLMWGEKDRDYIFPWEDFGYTTSKQILWDGYQDAKKFIGRPYCLSTRDVKGVCHGKACGACSDHETGKMLPELIKSIVMKRPAPVIPVEQIARDARSREKAYQLRVLLEVSDPIYRFVLKGYFSYAIARALMRSSTRFTSAFTTALGHARISAGANTARDWTFGRNIYDLALCEWFDEQELKALIEPANQELRQAKILDLRMDSAMSGLRKDIDYVVYTTLIPPAVMSYARIRDDLARYDERSDTGKTSKIKIKKAFGKDLIKTIEQELVDTDIRRLSHKWLPEYRATWLRFMIKPNYNPMAMLEAITGRKGFMWKALPIHADAYLQLPEQTGDVDVFAALAGNEATCKKCAGPLERDLFTGKPVTQDVCLSCDLSQLELDPAQFATKELEAVSAG